MDHQFQPPQNDKDFERFCCDFLRVYWPNSNPQKWGRSGQKQRGVDIIDMHAMEPLRGAQSKFRKPRVVLLADELEDEVNESKTFDLNGLKLGRYTILTTSENDTELQGKVVSLNHSHRKDGLFEIELLTWEMIEEVLRENPELWERAIGKSLKSLVAPVEAQMSEIQRSMVAVQVHLEELSGSSTSGTIDSRLEAVKAHLNAHRQQEGELLLRSLQANEWAEMSGGQRFRTLSLLGRVAADRGDHEQAGRYFIEGAQHLPDDERAKTNRAVGLELVGDRSAAYGLARALSKEYAGSVRPWAVICRTAPDEISYADLEAELPSQCRDDIEVLVGLAYRAARRADWVAVERLCQKAACPESEWAAPWTLLGQAKSQLSLRRAFKSGTQHVVFEERKDFDESLRCYDRAVEFAERAQNLTLLMDSLLHRARARAIIGNLAGADEDYAEATRRRPHDPIVIEQYGRYVLCYEDAGAAIAILRRAVSYGGGADAKCALAVALMSVDEKQNRAEYTSLACEAARDSRTFFRYDAIELTLRGMVNGERFDDAQAFLCSLAEKEIPVSAIEAGHARVEFARGNRELTQQRVTSAIAGLAGVSAPECRRFIAETLSLTGNHVPAMTEWQRLAAESRSLPDVWRLVDEAKRLGRHDLIRDVCQEWREVGVKDTKLIQEELGVLERYEPQRAVTLIQQLLNVTPHDPYLVLRLSLLGIRLGRPELICGDPGRLPSSDEANPRHGIAVVSSLDEAGNPLGAVQFAYRLLRRHPRSPEANANFAWSMLLTEESVPSRAFAPPDVVLPGSAFSYVESGLNEEQWFVIEDAGGPPVFDDELPPDHALARKVTGLRPGDAFQIDGDDIDGRKASIHAVASKYGYRLSKILKEWQVRFPGLPGFQMFRIDGADDSSGRLPDFTPIIRRVYQRREHLAEALAAYYQTPIPIQVLAANLGLDDADTLAVLAQDPRNSVRCCSASSDEFDRATGGLRAAACCVIDITAVTTLRLLKLEQVITKWPVPLVVSTATLSQLLSVSKRNFGRGGGGSVIPADYGIGIQFVERSEEEVEAARRNAEAAVALLRKHVEVRDCPGLADMPNERREMYIKALGQHGAETMILASAPGHMLWTDDFAFALIAQQEFGGRRVWTQAALDVATLRGVLEPSEFYAASARLLGYRYESIRYSLPVLHAACVIAEWDPAAFPLKQALKELSAGSNPDARAQIALMFLLELFREPILHVRHEEVALAVLNSLASTPAGLAAIRTFRQRLPELLRFDITAERLLRRLIGQFLKVRGDQ